VERPRRHQNDGTSMLQKAMELKKRKIMEPIKGNPFAALSIENFEQLTVAMKLQVRSGRAESRNVIESLVGREKEGYETFVDNHPEVILPATLDIQERGLDMRGTNKNDLANGEVSTPMQSIKDDESSLSWTDVVRRGKTRSRINKNRINERDCLEHKMHE
jgi:hypothetical protein